MHGNLEVEENENAVLYGLRNIFNRINFPVIIAGKNPSEILKTEIAQLGNTVLVENPTEPEMDSLQHNAHIHLCITFQASGLKLKLLNSLYKGRFVVANSLMTEGSGLKELTVAGDNEYEIIDAINRLIPCIFDPGKRMERERLLKHFGNKENALKIISLI
jgi:hypothetical protein